MKPTKQQIDVLQYPTSLGGSSCSACRKHGSPSPISDLPLLVQAEVTKFLRFIDKVLGRLNSIATQLCDGYLEELRLCPENYDQLASYHVDLLARTIAKEVDALYQVLQVSTIEHIEMWYERQSLENCREDHKEPKPAS